MVLVQENGADWLAFSSPLNFSLSKHGLIQGHKQVKVSGPNKAAFEQRFRPVTCESITPFLPPGVCSLSNEYYLKQLWLGMDG